MTDRVHGQREIMVRALSDPMFKIPAISGATELGDGRPVLILDALNLMQAGRRHKRNAPALEIQREASYA